MNENKPEQELEALQDQSDQLGEEISEARDDWESKKADPAVPGADGDPEAADSDHANEQFPAVGDADRATESEHPTNPLAEVGETAADATDGDG